MHVLNGKWEILLTVRRYRRKVAMEQLIFTQGQVIDCQLASSSSGFDFDLKAFLNDEGSYFKRIY